MTASSEVAATTVDKTGASEAEFQALLERDGDELTVDKVAAAIASTYGPEYDWHRLTHTSQQSFRAKARAAIDALKGPAL